MIPLYDENPTIKFPIITLLIIMINVLVFAWEMSLGSIGLNEAVVQYGFIPNNISNSIAHPNLLGPVFLSLFTSMFLHAGFIHIFGNMLYLWIFGNNIEDLLGHFKFFIFYFLSGLAGIAGQTLIDPHSMVPGLGASGAIAGVLGAYLIKFPKAKVVTVVPIFFFFQLIRLPAIVVLGFWIVIQLTSGFANLADGNNFGGGVAWFAHIGGFVIGIILTIILAKSTRLKKRF